MTPQQFGNVEADKVASSHSTENIIELSFKDLTDRLIQLSGWSILCNGNVPLLESPKLRKSSINMTRYCEERQLRYASPYKYNIDMLRILGSTRMSVKQHAAKVKLLLGQYYDDFCFLNFGAQAITQCSCGCVNVVSSWIANCKRTEIQDIRNQTMDRVANIWKPYDALGSFFRSLLQDAQMNDYEQFWRGNWQQTHIDRITEEMLAYDWRRHYSSLSLWFKKAFRLIRKCLLTIMDGLLQMRSISQDRILDVYL